ncbi:hypothetical protein CEP51_016852 [Fusarium floridanum]|uniref:Uncharacterized protein n=1 Tax=Fusarium floridanum TaxID=1325733 RepID=A0A428NE31_9HYPO|nr:hypothetical protein CEP51_016852 [Fusarium floridanum]
MKIEHSCGNAFSSQDVRDMVSTYLASAAERQAKRRSLLKTEVEPESDWDSDSDVDDAGAQEGLIQEQLLHSFIFVSQLDNPPEGKHPSLIPYRP